MYLQSSPKCQQLTDALQSWGLLDGEEAPALLLTQPGAWAQGPQPSHHSPRRTDTVLLSLPSHLHLGWLGCAAP